MSNKQQLQANNETLATLVEQLANNPTATELQRAIETHTENTENPHGVTAKQIGLGVENINVNFFENLITGGRVAYSSVRKQGNVINGAIELWSDSTFGTGAKVLFTVNSKYKPANYMIPNTILFDSNDAVTNGNCYIQFIHQNCYFVNNNANVAKIIMTFTYICP